MSGCWHTLATLQVLYMAWHLAYSSFAIPNANAPVYWRWENFSLERITGNEAFAKEMSVRFTSSSRLGSSQYSHRRPITEGVSNQRNVKRNAMGSALWFTDAHPKLISHALPVSHHPQLQAAWYLFYASQHATPISVCMWGAQILLEAFSNIGSRC